MHRSTRPHNSQLPSDDTRHRPDGVVPPLSLDRPRRRATAHTSGGGRERCGWNKREDHHARLRGEERRREGGGAARGLGSEGRRGGEEWRSRGSPDHLKKKKENVARIG